MEKSLKAKLLQDGRHVAIEIADQHFWQLQLLKYLAAMSRVTEDGGVEVVGNRPY